MIWRIVNKVTGSYWRSARGLTSWTTFASARLAWKAIPDKSDWELKMYQCEEV